MKSSQPERSPRPSTRAASQASVHPRACTKLDGETITDRVIRLLLDDARAEGAARLGVVCSKALLHPALAKGPIQVARRTAARCHCAREINHRAARWLDFGREHPRAYARDEKYAQLLGLVASDWASSIGEAARRGGPDRAPARHPLCWECNDALDDGDHRVVTTQGGRDVVVHAECVGNVPAERPAFADGWDDTLDLDEND